jgi:hypothetical protein
MSRIDIEELHERAWMPASVRNYMTDALQFVMGAAGVYRPVVRPLGSAVNAAGASRVVDLCSGGGGPWPWLYKKVQQERGANFPIVLTDKYPNLTAFERAHSASGGAIDFWREPVDASHLPENLNGFRTLFTSFHHFAPAAAVGILRGAVEQRQGIGVFDLPRRSVWTAVQVFLVPFGALLAAPFTRPFRWGRLFWTYVIPAVPFLLWFDGLLSCLRAYTPAEMMELAEQAGVRDYEWEAGEIGRSAKVTYLLGIPKPPQPAA